MHTLNKKNLCGEKRSHLLRDVSKWARALRINALEKLQCPPVLLRCGFRSMPVFLLTKHDSGITHQKRAKSL
jgi:hypothetical protein